MRFLLAASLLLLLLACTACAKQGKYWVNGLTLPPGAKVVSQTVTTEMEGMPADIPMMGTIDEMLMVSFDHNGGWPAVSTHIDSVLTAQGYTDSFAGMAGLMGGAAPPGGANPFDSMRMYSKSGEKFTVMLINSTDMAQQAGGQAMKIPGMGQYMLHVMRFK